MSQQDFREEYNPYAPPTDGGESGGRSFGKALDPDDEVHITADHGARFLGRLVDNLLVFVACVPAAGVWMIDRNNAPMAAALGVIPLGVLIYQWYLISTTGQSVGKKVTRTRIVKMNGAPVDFVSGVLVREWVFFGLSAIPTIGSVFRIVDSVMIFGRERRCLHDKAAGTKVIIADLGT